MESRVQLTANRLQAEHTELQQQLNAEQTKKSNSLQISEKQQWLGS